FIKMPGRENDRIGSLLVAHQLECLSHIVGNVALDLHGVLSLLLHLFRRPRPGINAKPDRSAAAACLLESRRARARAGPVRPVGRNVTACCEFLAVPAGWRVLPWPPAVGCSTAALPAAFPPVRAPRPRNHPAAPHPAKAVPAPAPAS